MANTAQIVRAILEIVFFGGLFGWAIIYTIRKADDPARMIFKWVLTAVMLWVLIWKVGDFVTKGGAAGAYIGVPFAAVCGLVLAFIWRHDIASLVAKPFSSLYDGGDAEPDPHPAYS